MKVLFAVSNESVSDAIVKKYQKDYKEIITYKNVYYFNAILKEIQRDKTYDRIVISEDLEPFANNDYEAIDRFIFDKLDSISDEAIDSEGGDTPIILICSDRRAKSEQLLVRLFGIGVYSALLGQDRSIAEVCKLIKKPRTKKEAKIYYKIESDDVNYQSENEDSVSEVEIQNIRAHYKKLGKNEDAYVESFNNIASQYTDAQLRVIVKFLPLNVKAVLETSSPKYQSIMAFSSGGVSSKPHKKQPEKKEDSLQIDFIENQLSKPKLTKPVIVPSAVNMEKVTKLSRQKPTETLASQTDELPKQENQNLGKIESIPPIQPIQEIPQQEKVTNTEVSLQDLLDNELEDTPKKGRGRPRKVVDESENKVVTPKRGRGRPKKVLDTTTESNMEEINLFDLDTETAFSNKTDNNVENNTLPGFEEDYEDNENISEENNTEVKNENILPGFEEDSQENIKDTIEEPISTTYSAEPVKTSYNPEVVIGTENNNTATFAQNETQKEILSNVNQTQSINIENMISGDKKIVSFVGTTKNGTSFLVNNLAELFSSMGINTAILDVTKNKNSYYIYTKNDETLRKVAFQCMQNLENGIANGIKVNKNLTVYTSLPTDEQANAEQVIATLLKTHSLVLIDCDFNTPFTYFEKAQEIYLVQSMDILTIQPLTAFLRELKAKNILAAEKIRVVINKQLGIRSLNPKVIIGGMAYYNDPAMSFMTELFNKDTVKHCEIPFDEQVYSKYLDGLVDCTVSLNGYSKPFMQSLKELANMVYPLLNNKYRPVKNYEVNNTFSSKTNDTLEQMKNKY